MSGARREVGAPDAGRDQAPGAGRRFTIAAQRSPGWTGPAIVGPRWWVRSAIRWYRPFSPPDDLHDTLVCSWDATVGGRHRLIPDGCVDLLWLDGGGGGDGRLTVCGPELRSWSFALPTGTRAVGVRFRPGVAAAALRQGMDDLVDRRVALDDLVGSATARRLAEQVAEAAGACDRQRHLLEGFVRRASARGPASDTVVDGVARALRRQATPTAVLADHAGLSTRQLHRRCTAAFGYGPATLARILRFQRVVGQALAGAPATLATLAADAGYADQAHLTRECRQITGETPSTVLANLVETSVDGIADLAADRAAA